MRRSILLCAALLALFPACMKRAVDEYAMITFMIGDVSKNSAPVRIGDIVRERDIIETGNDSFCDVKIGESLIRIRQKTRLEFASLIGKARKENTSLEMLTGKMICKPKKLLKDESFTIRTPTAVAGVRGTQFTVEADASGTSRIKVFEGKVKVAKRIRSLDDRIPHILAIAPDLEKEEKVVVTMEDVEKARKAVDAVMNMESEKGGQAALDAVIGRAAKDIAVSKRNIEKFSARDFEKDGRDVIAVREKTAEVKKRIERAIDDDVEAPRAEGRLLVTRYEVFFIQDGKVEWEGKVIQAPVKHGGRLYIASGEYVFCASLDGPVIWKKELDNNGRLRMGDGRLIVESQEGETSLDLKTGRRL